MTEPKHADLQHARSRALGVLTGILIALSVFSLLWYMFVPRADGVYDETNMRETATYQTPIERLQGAVQDASESTMAPQRINDKNFFMYIPQ